MPKTIKITQFPGWRGICNEFGAAIRAQFGDTVTLSTETLKAGYDWAKQRGYGYRFVEFVLGPKVANSPVKLPAKMTNAMKKAVAKEKELDRAATKAANDRVRMENILEREETKLTKARDAILLAKALNWKGPVTKKKPTPVQHAL